jgi:signal peptide peptidase SppA
LYDVVSAPWAITPEMFSEVQGIYARHCRGEKLDLHTLEARVGAPLGNVRQPLLVENGVAVISIEGVIAKRANLFMRISGGTSTQIIADQFAQALEDPAVRAIVLAIDSPGGTVDGTQALADQIYAARGQKPIVAVADGIMASAAYWIGSAADRVYISGDTTQVGSIGVITTHVDMSARDMQAGVRVTEIKAGKYKQAGSSNAPLGMAEKDTLQAAVDQVYGVFLVAVARHRGVDVETAQQNMADGRVFMGRNAIEAGLVDGVATLDQLVAQAASGTAVPSAIPQAALAGVAQQAINNDGDVAMDKLTVDKVRAEAPDVAQAIHAEGLAEGKALGIALGTAEGAKAERERIQAIEALARAGHEALIKEMKFDGKTTGPEAAVRILAAIDAQNAQRLKDLREDATCAVAAAAAAPKDSPGTAFDPHAVATQARARIVEQAKLGITLNEAQAVAQVLAEAKTHG